MEQSLLEQNLEVPNLLEVQEAPTAPLLPSYQPTAWSFVNRVLDIVDTITGRRAVWCQRFFMFAFIGGLAALVNMVVFYLVIDVLALPVHEMIHNVVASVLAAEISIMTSFVPNDLLTFHHLSGHQRSWVVRCVRYHITTASGSVLIFVIQFALSHLLHVQPIIGQAIALIFVLFYNFSFHHIFTYRPAQPGRGERLPCGLESDLPPGSHSVANTSGFQFVPPADWVLLHNACSPLHGSALASGPGSFVQYPSLADYETKKLPIIKLVYDVDTVVLGTIKPVHNVNTTVVRAPGKAKSSIIASDTPISKSWRNYPLKMLIIIPTYNELENLPLLLKEIFSYAPQTHVLIVDDNSPDGTGKLAEEIRKKNARVHVLHRPGKLGLGTAYIAGFKYALAHGYDAAFEMDADFSHDPRYLPDFLTAIERADLVIGSRYIPGGCMPNWSFIRRLISCSGNIFARFVLGIPVHDCTGGFRCYRSQVLQCIDLDAIQSRGYTFQVELTYRVLKQGFRIVETPITFMDRRLGTSKMSRKIVIEAFTYVLRTRLSKQFSVLASPALQSNDQIPGTIIPDTQKEEQSSVATKPIARLKQAALGSIRPVKLLPLQ